MKHYLKVSSLLLYISVGVCVLACDKKSEQKSEQPSTPNTPLNPQALGGGELLKAIVGEPTGLFRGFSIGDAVSKIKATEKFEIFEDSTDHVGFTYETENFETVDVLYYLDNNQTLTSIRGDVFLNNINTTKNLLDQLETYFSGKFKAEKPEGNTKFWSGDGGVSVRLKDVTVGKDYGLQFSIGLKNSKAMR
jgi:hypothetical protein